MQKAYLDKRPCCILSLVCSIIRTLGDPACPPSHKSSFLLTAFDVAELGRVMFRCFQDTEWWLEPPQHIAGAQMDPTFPFGRQSVCPEPYCPRLADATPRLEVFGPESGPAANITRREHGVRTGLASCASPALYR
jgi:hypothetical protein